MTHGLAADFCPSAHRLRSVGRPVPLTTRGLPGKAVLGWTHGHRRPPSGRVGNPRAPPASSDPPHFRGNACDAAFGAVGLGHGGGLPTQQPLFALSSSASQSVESRRRRAWGGGMLPPTPGGASRPPPGLSPVSRPWRLLCLHPGAGPWAGWRPRVLGAAPPAVSNVAGRSGRLLAALHWTPRLCRALLWGWSFSPERTPPLS